MYLGVAFAAATDPVTHVREVFVALGASRALAAALAARFLKNARTRATVSHARTLGNVDFVLLGKLVRTLLAAARLPVRRTRDPTAPPSSVAPDPEMASSPSGWLSVSQLPEGRALVRVFGVLDLRIAGAAGGRLAATMGAHPTVCVDLGHLMDVDLAGVQLITGLPQLARENDCRLQLRQAPPHVQQLIERADPDRRLPFALWR